MKIQILPKTWNVIKLQSIYPLQHAPMNLQRLYEIELDEEVIDELIRRGADLSDPESIHRVVVDAIP